MNKKIHNLVFIALAVFLLAGLVAGCTSSVAPTLTQRVHYIDADYPSYRTIGEITANSALVVYGEVVKVLPPVRVIPEVVPVAQLPKEKADAIGYLVTDVIFRIDRVLSGQKDMTGKQITISQLGGETATDKYIAESEPLSQQGNTYILFLQPQDSGRYMASGGVQGRYSVREGRISAMAQEYVSSASVTSVLQNMSVDEFLNNFGSMANVEVMPQAAVEVDEPLMKSPLPDGTSKSIEQAEQSKRVFLPLIQAK